MAQVFSKRANLYVKVALLAIAIGVPAAFVLGGAYYRSPYYTGQGVAPEQPVPFSHRHHVGGLGLDCRYCHTSVEKSQFAGIPATDTCMTCHSQLWTNAEMLEPVRRSWREAKPLFWNRVHDLPDFVYFNHSIHVAKGVGCETCHGRVDRMALTYQAESLQMQWCLDCHRDPAKYLRPKEEVYTMGWRPPKNRREAGEELVERYGLRKQIMTDCSTCHR